MTKIDVKPIVAVLNRLLQTELAVWCKNARDEGKQQARYDDDYDDGGGHQMEPARSIFSGRRADRGYRVDVGHVNARQQRTRCICEGDK